MDASTQAESKPRGAGSKRKWSPEERQTIVRASLKSGATVNAVARMYGVNASQIYDWRKQARQAGQQAKTARMIPVRVAEAHQPSPGETKQSCSVVIEAQGTRVTVTGRIDAAVIRAVLECVAR